MEMGIVLGKRAGYLRMRLASLRSAGLGIKTDNWANRGQGSWQQYNWGEGRTM